MGPKILQDVLGRAEFSGMQHVWQDRSNVTQWWWVTFARKLQSDASQQRVRELAACLYSACKWYTQRRKSETFIGQDVLAKDWALISLVVDDLLTQQRKAQRNEDNIRQH